MQRNIIGLHNALTDQIHAMRTFLVLQHEAYISTVDVVIVATEDKIIVAVQRLALPAAGILSVSGWEIKSSLVLCACVQR